MQYVRLLPTPHTKGNRTACILVLYTYATGGDGWLFILRQSLRPEITFFTFYVYMPDIYIIPGTWYSF